MIMCNHFVHIFLHMFRMGFLIFQRRTFTIVPLGKIQSNNLLSRCFILCPVGIKYDPTTQ